MIATWVLVPQGDVITGDSQLGISKTNLMHNIGML